MASLAISATILVPTQNSFACNSGHGILYPKNNNALRSHANINLGGNAGPQQ